MDEKMKLPRAKVIISGKDKVSRKKYRDLLSKEALYRGMTIDELWEKMKHANSSELIDIICGIEEKI